MLLLDACKQSNILYNYAILQVVIGLDSLPEEVYNIILVDASFSEQLLFDLAIPSNYLNGVSFQKTAVYKFNMAGKPAVV